MSRYIIPLMLVLAVSCGRREPAVEAGSEAAAEAADDQALHLEPELVEAWGIKVGTISSSDISSRVILPGVVALNENRTAHISSFMEGKASKLSVDLGDNVRQGQTLVTLNSPAFAQAQASFLEANARFNFSQQEYERARTLFQERAIEEKEFLRRQAEHEQTTVELGAAGSALQSYGKDYAWIEELKEKCDRLLRDGGDPCIVADPNLTVVSPIRGTVIFRDVIVGEHIDAQKTLFTVSDLGTLWAHLDAYENDLPFISYGSEVVIRSPLYSDRIFPGKITYISDLVDEKLRTVRVRVEVTNTGGLLKPNMYIQGVVQNSDPARVYLTVPEEAIVLLDGEKTVFVLESEEEAEEEEDHMVFHAHHVVTGEMIGDMRIITWGLEEGEIVVLKGAFTLKAELAKATVGEVHVH